MSRIRLFVLASAFAVAFALLMPWGGTPVQAQTKVHDIQVTVQDVEDSLSNDWFGIYFQGKKIGFTNDAVEKVTENDQTFYRVRSSTQMKLLALEQKGVIKMDQVLDFQSKPPFQLLRGESINDDGNSKQRMELVATAKGYEVTLTVGKVTEKKTLGSLNYTLADAVASAVWLRKYPNKGETLTAAHFNFQELKVDLVTAKLLGTKEVAFGGATVKVQEVEIFEHDTKTTAVMLFDAKAQIVSGTMAGMFELKRESKIDATTTEFSGDFITVGMAKLDRPIGDLRKVEGLVLKAKGKEIGGLPQTMLQSVTYVGDDTYVLKIGKQHGKKIKATEKEIRDALEESPTYPLKDAKVVELAKLAIGDAQTDQDKVKRLCKFVHEYIKYQIVYMPKVHDLLERKVGDCKSYALLFTCLSRAIGMPAREVSGFFYMGDEIKGFGGHAWNEVLIDGHWVQVDATINLTDLVPFYVCVATGRENGEGMMRVFGKLSFELVEAQMAQ